MTPIFRSQALAAMMKNREFLESKTVVELTNVLPNVISREWNSPLKEIKEAMRDLEDYHIRGLRDTLQWEPLEGSKRYEKLMAQKIALKLKKETEEKEKAEKATTEEKGSDRKYLVLASDLHDTLKQVVQLLNRAEQRDERRIKDVVERALDDYTNPPKLVPTPSSVKKPDQIYDQWTLPIEEQANPGTKRQYYETKSTTTALSK